MTQTATVMRILDGNTAEIEVQRKTACGGNCESCGGACAAGAAVRVRAVNGISAAVGDRVTVETRSSRIIGAAALVYLLPLGAFFLAYALGAALGLNEDGCLLTSFGGLVLGLALVVLISRAMKKRRPITFEITGIL